MRDLTDTGSSAERHPRARRGAKSQHCHRSTGNPIGPRPLSFPNASYDYDWNGDISQRGATNIMIQALAQRYQNRPHWHFLREFLPFVDGKRSVHPMDGFALRFRKSRGEYTRIAFELKASKSDLYHDIERFWDLHGDAVRFTNYFYYVVPHLMLRSMPYLHQEIGIDVGLMAIDLRTHEVTFERAGDFQATPQDTHWGLAAMLVRRCVEIREGVKGGVA